MSAATFAAVVRRRRRRQALAAAGGAALAVLSHPLARIALWALFWLALLAATGPHTDPFPLPLERR